MFRNDLQIFSKCEDQFNFVDSPNGQIVIYSTEMYIKHLVLPSKKY